MRRAVASSHSCKSWFLSILFLCLANQSGKAAELEGEALDTPNCQGNEKLIQSGIQLAQREHFAIAIEKFLTIAEICRSDDIYFLIANSANYLHRCEDAKNYLGKVRESELVNITHNKYHEVSLRIASCPEQVRYDFQTISIKDDKLTWPNDRYSKEIQTRLYLHGRNLEEICNAPCRKWLSPQEIFLDSTEYPLQRIKLPNHNATISIYRSPIFYRGSLFGLAMLGLSIGPLYIGSEFILQRTYCEQRNIIFDFQCNPDAFGKPSTLWIPIALAIAMDIGAITSIVLSFKKKTWYTIR